jgi:hypothetical protein
MLLITLSPLVSCKEQIFSVPKVINCKDRSLGQMNLNFGVK